MKWIRVCRIEDKGKDKKEKGKDKKKALGLRDWRDLTGERERKERQGPREGQRLGEGR